MTRGRASPARSGRPPRETIAPTRFGRPGRRQECRARPRYWRRNSPGGAPSVSGWPASQSAAACKPVGQQPDVEDLRAVVGLVVLQQVEEERGEAGLLQDPATYWLRGLNRPLPLPCAKTTTAEPPRGCLRVPRMVRLPAGMRRLALERPFEFIGASLMEDVGFARPRSRRRRPSSARASSSLTSSSSVWAKSSYHMPTARNGSGVKAQMTSSAIAWNSAQVDEAPIGTATTIRAGSLLSQGRHRGPHGRSGGQAVVDQDHGLAADVDRRAVVAVGRLASGQLPALARRSRRAISSAWTFIALTTSSFITTTSPEAIAPMASSSCPGAPSLRTRKTSSGDAQRRGDLVGDRHAAPRQGQDDHVVPAGIGRQLLGQHLPGFRPIREWPAHDLPRRTSRRPIDEQKRPARAAVRRRRTGGLP